jgi:peptidoglycan hydrolase-like protein with peptidoglycan-binding domain
VTYSYSTGGGNLTAEVQSALANNGYDPGPVDGVMGPGTRDAIAAFQSDHGLTPTGRIDQPLLDNLGIR